LDRSQLRPVLNIKGGIERDKFKVKLSDASSGFQSVVPLYLVSEYLAKSVRKESESNATMSTEGMNRFKNGVKDIWSNDDLTDEQKRLAISVLSSKFNKTAFVNIVEEPEQNLFPNSQWDLLKSLFEFNNMNAGNKLIMTTHSPYIINYLSIAIQAGYLKDEIKLESKDELLKKLNKVVPLESAIASNNVAVYQFDERGVIEKLNDYDGIPSDKKFLNESLAKGNSLFDLLLEIEQELIHLNPILPQQTHNTI